MTDEMDRAVKAADAARPMPAEIIKAIVAVTSEVKKLAKEGNNTFQRYKFVSVDQFYEALGPLMASHGLCDVAFEVSTAVETRETTNDRGEVKRGAWLMAQYDFWLYHESGASFGPIQRHIQVQASGPQSYASAQSFAEKYFLRNLFKVPTGDIDEVDASDKQGLPTAQKISVEQIKALNDEIIDQEPDAKKARALFAKLCEWLEITHGVKVQNIEDIPAGFFHNLMMRLNERRKNLAKGAAANGA